jgi:reductive dehalogenase
MQNIISTSLIILGSLFLFLLSSFAWVSHREGERRAATTSLFAAILGAALFFLALLLPLSTQFIFLIVFISLGVLGTILFLLPIGQIDHLPDVPEGRFDERDIVFARARMKPGSPEFDSYYRMRPENKAIDEKFRKLPGLLSPTALKANHAAFASASASFQLTHAVRDEVDGAVSTDSSSHSPELNSAFIKGYTRYLGAVSVGITTLEPFHVYSHIGRGSGEYGAPITLDHKYAIAFSVEMDHQIMGTAPEAPVVMESARQYVEAAKIAVTLGTYLRLQGYPARAHIDGNYRVIAPLVARDAGLGEIGRISILMTPELGPRVRLGVVTTDFPLIPDKRMDGGAMIDFCTFCKKCAENCPSRSIPFDDREEIDGAWRWRIDADTCFRYWNAIGTDCGVCMAVCPYSHPDNWAHNAVRWAILRSGFARRAALWMDDLTYGRKPAPRPTPDWLQD